jgi:hypothetical protein
MEKYFHRQNIKKKDEKKLEVYMINEALDKFISFPLDTLHMKQRKNVFPQ